MDVEQNIVLPEGQKELNDFFGDPNAELCEELKMWLFPGPPFETLKHPLVYSVPYHSMMNDLHNRQLKHKKEGLARAEAEGKWSSYIFLHERPHRLFAFQRIYKKLTDEQYWDLLALVWRDSENIWQNKPLWKKLLKSKRPGSFMSPDDKKLFDALPETFTVYRGYQHGKNRQGLSYTLNREYAEALSKRWARDGEPRVLERVVNKKDVFAFTDERNEKEIIIL